MSFWDFFSKHLNKQEGSSEAQQFSRLHDKIQARLPEGTSEKNQALTACLAGLLARMAYVDLKVEKPEVEQMQAILKKFTDLDQETISATIDLATQEIVELAGAENHLYCSPLNEVLSKEERYQILEALFAFAASDGNADGYESEEIRLISKALLLEHQHYVAAKATVVQHLGALKK